MRDGPSSSIKTTRLRYKRKRKQLWDVIKKLKEKNMKAESPYPAQLKMFPESGTKTFTKLLL